MSHLTLDPVQLAKLLDAICASESIRIVQCAREHCGTHCGTVLVIAERGPSEVYRDGMLRKYESFAQCGSCRKHFCFAHLSLDMLTGKDTICLPCKRIKIESEKHILQKKM